MITKFDEFLNEKKSTEKDKECKECCKKCECDPCECPKEDKAGKTIKKPMKKGEEEPADKKEGGAIKFGSPEWRAKYMKKKK